MNARREGEDGAKRRDDVDIHGPMGWWVRIPAKYLSGSLISVLAFVGFGYMLRDHDLRQTALLTDYARERSLQMADIRRAQTDLQKTMDVMVYVLSMSPEERAKLHMDMPAALRDKLQDERPEHR